MPPPDWSTIDLSGDPRLLLGRRKSSKRLEVHRVELHEDLFEDLRSIAQATIAELERRDTKPYAPFGSITSDEYFEVDTSDIPKRRDRRKREEDPEAYEIAAALSMIAQTDNHAVMTAEELRAADPTLYAIAFEDNGEYIGFIRNRSPQRVVKPGLRYLQYGDTLRRVDPPDLAIDDTIDLMVGGDRCAVLSMTAFTTLFGDVGIAFQQVPANISSMSEALKDSLPLSAESVTALQERCGRRVIDAKRLQHIVNERGDALRTLSADEIRDLIKKRGMQDVERNGELNLTSQLVSDFLDLVEGRLFNDDVTGEERRADTYSPRGHGPGPP